MTKKDFFIPKMFYRLLVPSVISSFGFALADMADALVVGSRLGETGLAAISLALPVYMLINLFMDGFGIGGSVYFSQKLGEGDTEEARSCFNRTWTAVLAFGLIIAAIINIFPRQCLGLLGTVPSDGEVYTACLDYIRIVALGAPLLMLNVVFANFLRNDGKRKQSRGNQNTAVRSEPAPGYALFQNGIFHLVKAPFAACIFPCDKQAPYGKIG